jgi:topoisomerase-4 subunit A
MLGVVVMAPGATVVVHSGKRYIKLRGSDLDAYRGERGRRGNKLPRGFQKVERIEVATD